MVFPLLKILTVMGTEIRELVKKIRQMMIDLIIAKIRRQVRPYSLLRKNSLTKYLRYLQKYLYGMKNKASILLNYFFLISYIFQEVYSKFLK